MSAVVEEQRMSESEHAGGNKIQRP